MLKPIIGILGGGQLGMMLCDAAKKIGLETHTFCPDDECPSKSKSTYFTIGEYTDEKKIIKFSNEVDFITYEFENIPIKTIDFIKDKEKIRPGKLSLLLTQDRLVEKEFLEKLNIPIAPYKVIRNSNDISSAQSEFTNSIVKTRTLGYDGKGQFSLSKSDNPDEVFKKIKNKSIVEKKIPFEFEVSVIIARDKKNNLSYFPIGRNIHENHILKYTYTPFDLSQTQTEELINYSKMIISELNHIGVLAVEFFVTKNKILVNEIAPRVHNSGHWTIDACNVSQFEQHMICVSGGKIKKPLLKYSAQMTNIIGDEIYEWCDKNNTDNVKIHLYNKNEVKKGRKMGHVTELFDKDRTF